LALMVFSSIISYLKAGKIRRSQDAAFEVRVPSFVAAIQLQRDLNQTQVKGRQAILAGTQPARLAETRKLFEQTWKDVERDIAVIERLAPSWTDPENRDRMKEIQKQLPLLRAVQEAAITRGASREHNALAKAGNDSADRATPINIATKKSLGSLADSFDKQVADTKNELSADNRSLNLTVALTTFAAFVIGISVAVLLERIISGATRSVLVRAEAIAAGDLAFDDLEVRSQDELGDLTRAINTMSGNLKRMILRHIAKFTSSGQRQRGTFLFGHAAGTGSRPPEGPSGAGRNGHAGNVMHGSAGFRKLHSRCGSVAQGCRNSSRRRYGRGTSLGPNELDR
ncbi:MAG: methyl-accepting chemotaxis protein, partial [Candidatus Sulfotelmatobacter sp.]